MKTTPLPLIGLSYQTALSTAKEALEGPLDRILPSFGPFRPGAQVVWALVGKSVNPLIRKLTELNF